MPVGVSILVYRLSMSMVNKKEFDGILSVTILEIKSYVSYK